MWMILANRLHKTVSEAQNGMTLSEFDRWCHFIMEERKREEQERKDEIERHSKQDYYFAQLAFEIHLLRASWVTVPNRKFEDFLLSFTFGEPEVKKEKKPLHERAEDSLAMWSAIFSSMGSQS